MALEAARQLCGVRDTDDDSLRISNLHFERQLPLSVFSETDTAVELQLIARRMDRSHKFEFEIFSQNLADENSWTRHCYGSLETLVLAESPILKSQKIVHDQALLDQARAFQKGVGVGLSNLKMSLEGSSGEFEHSLDEAETYVLHPSVLHSILTLPPVSTLNQNLPAEKDLLSITSITVPVSPLWSSSGRFKVRVSPLEFCNVESDIEISQCKRIVSLKGLKYQATQLSLQKPALSSLFFKPVLLPDVERLLAVAPMSVSRCVELLTHKWPMCDIKIDNVPECYTLSILETLGALDQARSHFRSVKCASISAGVISYSTPLIDGSDPITKYHMIITQDASLGEQLSQQLHSGGLVCITKSHMQALKSDQNSLLQFVCEITGLGSDPWVLLRKSTDPCPTVTGRNAVVFSNQHGVPFFEVFERIEPILLNPQAVGQFCNQKHIPRFDAIVIDCPKKSVIATWKGFELMPWIKCLLRSADSILWVTRTSYENPFVKIAGSLLRTLQSEQPSLKISWLMVDERVDKEGDTFTRQIEQAFLRMVEGENELVTRSGESGPEILRYLPDDDLATDTGLSLPRKAKSPLGVKDYSLGLAAPEDPVILSYNASGIQSLSDDAIDVLVEVSVLDTDDIQRFEDRTEIEVSRPNAGLFFAGSVLNSQNLKIPLESRVVGWHPDHNHRKTLSVQYYDICQYPTSMQPSYAAFRYAVIAVASCIVDGAARARQGETFLIDVPGPILIATQQVCHSVGATVLNSSSGSIADFVVSIHNLDGICVNDRPIHLAKYLQSEHGRAMVHHYWKKFADLSLQFNEYEITDYKQAFKNAKRAHSAVLLHRNAAKIVDHVPIYTRAPQVFTNDANYVVIGGLGGLGRFICSWMIENGARHITVISRSGAGTLEARNAVSAMNSSGASIQCIKADACDRKAISKSFSQLRVERPIRGVINLAMVLGDAPMATMTAEEWDHGLRVKIDSGWILHEVSLQDHLDFFILFSSIASVLGNRSQGNYNVSNAFLNALAEYRQSLDLPGISVALGAMSKSLFFLICIACEGS